VEIVRLSQLRPRTVWDLIDDAFDLYRERFSHLAGLAAVPFVPAHLLNTLVTTLAYSRLQQAAGETDTSNLFTPLFVFLGATLAGQPILLAAQAIQTAVTARSVGARLEGEAPAARTVWRGVLPKLFPVILAGVLTSAFVLSGATITCGIGLFFFAPLVAFVPICQGYENLGVGAAFKRAWALATSNYARALGLGFLLYAIESLLHLGLTGLVQLLFLVIPGGSETGQSTGGFVTGQAATALAALFLAPLKGIALTLLYFDCRVRREGLDITALAAETDVPLAPPVVQR
jgi:hypothetical protein